jgi:uncharacterized repeat protein (TIGR01451 family)
MPSVRGRPKYLVRVIAIAACATWAAAMAPALAQAAPPGCDPARPAVAYYPGDTSVTVPSAPLVPCKYDTGARAMEPSLAFTPDGRVIYQGWELQAGSVGGVPPRPVVRRSNSSYTTWEDVSPIGPTESLDPFLTVDRRTGRIFSVNWLGNSEPNCATVSHSDDNGDSWVSSPLACNGFDGESIGVGPPVSSVTVGYPDIVYYCTGATLGSSPPATSPVCSKSLDGGLTFVPTGMPPWPIASGDQDEFGPWAGNPMVGSDGTVYVPKRSGGQPQVAISHDEGLSWTPVQVANNGSSGAAPRMAIDDAGNLYYAWTGDDHLPYLSSSRDGGTTWSAPIQLAPPALREAALPRPAATGDGRVVVAFLGSTDSPAVPPWYAFCNELLGECDDGAYAGTTWNGYITLVDDGLAPRPRLQTATVNPPDQPLFVGGCSADGGCKADLDFVDARFDPDGQPWAAFVDDCAIERDFTPIFGADAGRCEDFLGEGIVTRLYDPGADLAITKTDAPDPVSLGGVLTYTLTVTNNGPGAAGSVTATDQLPKNVTLRSARSDRGRCLQPRPRKVVCNLADLASGETATATIVVRPAKKGRIVNTATAQASQPIDRDPADNTATATTEVVP